MYSKKIIPSYKSYWNSYVKPISFVKPGDSSVKCINDKVTVVTDLHVDTDKTNFRASSISKTCYVKSSSVYHPIYECSDKSLISRNKKITEKNPAKPRKDQAVRKDHTNRYSGIKRCIYENHEKKISLEKLLFWLSVFWEVTMLCTFIYGNKNVFLNKKSESKIIVPISSQVNTTFEIDVQKNHHYFNHNFNYSQNISFNSYYCDQSFYHLILVYAQNASIFLF